jgi:hypothetical protein
MLVWYQQSLLKLLDITEDLVQSHLNEGEPIQIALADNSPVSAVGAVDIVVSVFEPTKSYCSSSSSVVKLVDTDVASSRV